MGTLSAGYVGMRVSKQQAIRLCRLTDGISIVEYATKDQAQQAVNTLSNQNLMGRLVYVREVSFLIEFITILTESSSKRRTTHSLS